MSDRRRARRGLGGLTVRGRAFVAAGATAVVCAVVLGQATLASAGVLAVALPLVSLVATRASRFEVHLRRGLSPTHVEVGGTSTVHLGLAVTGRVPRGTLLLEDQLPYVLGARPRMLVRGVRGAWTGDVSYPVRAEVRGRYETGPLVVRVRDLFGTVELVREFHHTGALIVRPQTHALPRGTLGEGSGTTGDEQLRAAAVGSAEDSSVRDYRIGDDLRRVHWRTTARTGELMVRREEERRETHAVVLLDNRASSHEGVGHGSSFEAAVVLAASLCAHLARLGSVVHLHDAGGLLVTAPAGPTGATRALDALAVIGLADRTDLAPVGPRGGAGRRDVHVALLGRLSPADDAALGAARARAVAAHAVVLDVARWHPDHRRPPSPSATVAAPPREVLHLAARGWNAVAVGPEDTVTGVWSALTAARRPAGAVR